MKWILNLKKHQPLVRKKILELDFFPTISYSTDYLDENSGMTIRGGHMENLKQHPMYQYLILLAISSTVTMTCWMTLFNNFAVEIAGLDGDQVGIIQSVREIPGFLTFFVIYIIILVKEHHLASLSVLLTCFTHSDPENPLSKEHRSPASHRVEPLSSCPSVNLPSPRVRGRGKM